MSNVRILFWNVQNFKGSNLTAFRKNFIAAVIQQVQPVLFAIVEGAETMEVPFSDLAAEFGALLGDHWSAIGSDQSRMIYDVQSFPATIDDMYAAGLMGICVPEKHGGHGADILTYSMNAAELGRIRSRGDLDGAFRAARRRACGRRRVPDIFLHYL